MGWFFVCFFLGIVDFPFYLVKQPTFRRINSQLSGRRTDEDVTTASNAQLGCLRRFLFSPNFEIELTLSITSQFQC